MNGQKRGLLNAVITSDDPAGTSRYLK